VRVRTNCQLETLRGVLVAVAVAILVTGCSSLPPSSTQENASSTPPVLSSRETIFVTSPSDYTALVGQRIELVGVVSHARVPQILGIDVAQLANHRGRRMKVAGILRQSVVTQAQIDATERQMGGAVANRGPGIYYYLEDIKHEMQP
jgi:hypothetical protein